MWTVYWLNLNQGQHLIIHLLQCLLVIAVGEEVEREQSGSHGVIQGCLVLQGISSLRSLGLGGQVELRSPLSVWNNRIMA